MHAIRSAIGTPAHDFAQERVRPKPDAAQAEPATTKPGWLGTITARGLLSILMLVAWPGGAVKALLYHLDGGDLRDWS